MNYNSKDLGSVPRLPDPVSRIASKQNIVPNSIKNQGSTVHADVEDLLRSDPVSSQDLSAALKTTKPSSDGKMERWKKISLFSFFIMISYKKFFFKMKYFMLYFTYFFTIYLALSISLLFMFHILFFLYILSNTSSSINKLSDTWHGRTSTDLSEQICTYIYRLIVLHFLVNQLTSLESSKISKYSNYFLY